MSLDFIDSHPVTARTQPIIRRIMTAAALCCGVFTAPAYGTDFTWTGDSIFDSSRWDDSANWFNTGIDLIGFPDDTSDQGTISDGQIAQLTVNRTIGDLSLRHGGRLFLGDKTLVINTSANQSGCACVFEEESRLFVGTGTLDTDNLDLRTRGAIDVRGGLVQVDVGARIRSSASLSGYGTFERAGGSGIIRVDGAIIADGGTLTVRRRSGSGELVVASPGALSVSSGSTLRIDIPTTLTVASVLIGGVDSHLDMIGDTTWHTTRVNDRPGAKANTLSQTGNATILGTTYIGVAEFIWDGNDRTLPSTTTIAAGAELWIDVDRIQSYWGRADGEDAFRGDLIIAEAGRLDVSNMSGSWAAQGRVLLQGAAEAIPQTVISGTASFVNGGQEVSGGSLVEGNGRFLVDVTNSLTGVIRPGLSAGHMLFEQDFTQDADGTLEIELGGAAAITQHDLVTILGDVELDGMLDVSLIDGFTLGVGQRFKIIDIFGETSGEFSGLPNRGLVGNFGEDLFITYTGGDGNDVVLYTTPLPITGDTNSDGLINIDDLNDVRNNFGAMGSDDGTLDGDAFPFDGLVNIDDLNAVRNNFGAGGSPVPEPSALALALTAIAIVWPTNCNRKPKLAFGRQFPKSSC